MPFARMSWPLVFFEMPPIEPKAVLSIVTGNNGMREKIRGRVDPKALPVYFLQPLSMIPPVFWNARGSQIPTILKIISALIVTDSQNLMTK